jgi:hypothetical protein
MAADPGPVSIRLLRYEAVATGKKYGILVPVYAKPKSIRQTGNPLLVYPLGDSPLERWLYHYY